MSFVFILSSLCVAGRGFPNGAKYMIFYLFSPCRPCYNCQCLGHAIIDDRGWRDFGTVSTTARKHGHNLFIFGSWDSQKTSPNCLKVQKWIVSWKLGNWWIVFRFVNRILTFFPQSVKRILTIFFSFPSSVTICFRCMLFQSTCSSTLVRWVNLYVEGSDPTFNSVPIRIRILRLK